LVYNFAILKLTELSSTTFSLKRTKKINKKHLIGYIGIESDSFVVLY